jgi:MFS family permease
LLNAVSYVAVLGSLRAMRSSELSLAPLAPRRTKGAVREAGRYVLDRPELVFVFVVAFAAGTFGLNFQITNALMATTVFDRGAGEYGILGSAMAVGSLTGALLAARRGGTSRLILVLSGVSFAVAEIAAGLMPSFWTFALWLPVVGICSITMLNSLQTFVQLAVAPELRGRVMALYMMVLMGGTPVGAPVIGWVGETFGPRWTLVAGGAITLVAVLGATRWLMRTEEVRLRDVSARPVRLAA